jgi:uncharacterized protein (DUF58 family)
MLHSLKTGALRWLFQWRGPESGTIVLVQRRVFILPTRQGMLFVLVIILMLTGSVNYDLSLGFILAFLLGAAGIQSMLLTFRNLAHLRLSGGRVQPVFAGEQAQFALHIANDTRADRYAIGVTGNGIAADYIDVAAGTSVMATVPLPALRRGWLRPGRMTLFTRFPTGLFRAWSYAEPDVQCLVYPAPATPGLPLPRPEAGNRAGGVSGQGQDEFSGLSLPARRFAAAHGLEGRGARRHPAHQAVCRTRRCRTVAVLECAARSHGCRTPPFTPDPMGA